MNTTLLFYSAILKRSILSVLLFFFLQVTCAASVLSIAQDTVMYDTMHDGNNVYDTVVVSNGARLTLAYPDTTSFFKSSYNLNAKNLFETKPGASAVGMEGKEGYLVVMDGVIANNSGNDSIRNISINLFGGATIQGYPSSFMHVIAGHGGRHISLDTTTTFKGDIFEGHNNSIILNGNMLILDDNAKIIANNTNYPYITFDNGGLVKRIISSDDLGVPDILPFGFSTSSGNAAWVSLTLHSTVTLGANPYIQYELIPLKHPEIPNTGHNPMNLYLKITGHDIDNLNYSVTLNFRDKDITEKKALFKSAFFSSDSTWKIGSYVNDISNTMRMDSLTAWGDLTAVSGDVQKIVVLPDTIYGINSAGMIVDTVKCPLQCLLPYSNFNDINAVDSVIIKEGASTYIQTLGKANQWQSQLIAEKLFMVEKNASVTGIGDSVRIGVEDTRFINNAGMDSIRNIRIEMHDSPLRIQGAHPTLLKGVHSSFGDRDIILDTTLIIDGQIWDGHRNSIILNGNNIILSKNAYFGSIKILNGDGHGGEGLPYPYIVSNEDGHVIRMITEENKNITDTIPIAVTKNADSLYLISLKLSNSVSLDSLASVAYTLFPYPHPAIGTPQSSLNSFVNISGFGINNLENSVTLHYPTLDISGFENQLVPAFYNDSAWESNTFIDYTNHLMQFNNLNKWGSFTALSGPVAETLSPADNSEGITIDTLVMVRFHETADSVDFSGITITNEAMDTISGIIANWNAATNTITITHDPFEMTAETYTVTIPSGSVINVHNLYNAEILWSFTSELFVDVVTTEAFQKEVAVYPNPAHEQVSIKAPTTGNQFIKICDMLGNVVLNQSGHIDNLDISFLSAGVYIITIITDEIQYTERLIIQ